MHNINLAWLLGAALFTTQCGHAPDDAPAGQAAGATSQAAPSDAPNRPRAPLPETADPAVRVPLDDLTIFGSAGALVTVVVFDDYECPYCAKADKTIATLRAELGDDVRLAVAMRPLPMHEHATAAARALLAAAAQGQGEAMHQRLFATRSSLDDDGLRASARAVGLDERAFEAARTSPATAETLARLDRLASSLGATGTPTFFVNGRRVRGAQPYATFKSLVEEERIRARALVDRGVAREQVYATLMAAAPVYVAKAPAAEPDTVVDVPLDDAPLRGAPRAPVAIVVFSDFECPYCVKLEATLRSLEATYPGQVKIAFRHRPLPMHDHARLAARAALAAEAQGKFWEMHDLLFAHRDALDRASLLGYAAALGLAQPRFESDLDDVRLDARLDADEARAAKLHVEGTPTAFVNGRRITGAQPIAIYRAAIDRALGR